MGTLELSRMEKRMKDAHTVSTTPDFGRASCSAVFEGLTTTDDW